MYISISLREFLAFGNVAGLTGKRTYKKRFPIANHRHLFTLKIFTSIQYRKALSNFTFAESQAFIADRCDVADQIIAVHHCRHPI